MMFNFQDTQQVLLLLILINLGLCSYYFLLYQENKKTREEDQLLLDLEEKFRTKLGQPPEGQAPAICHGFHDRFFDNNKFLGWRSFWLKRQNNDLVSPDKNFEGTRIRNFLDNQQNVINYITPDNQKIR